MVEKQHIYTVTDSKIIERLIEDDNVGINHMVLTKGDSLPEHYSNSNVYMIVSRGKVTLGLNDQKPASYQMGSILEIPYKTKMNVSNIDEGILELFVIKAPSPRQMKDK